REGLVKSIVSRGGRPDLAFDLERVKVPVLLIVGGGDFGVIDLNQDANRKLEHGEIAIVPGAGHLFEEVGALDQVIELSVNWFSQTLVETSAKVEPVRAVEKIVARSQYLARPLTAPKDISSLAGELSRQKIVMLGEATHGTEEFYLLRREIP